MDLNKVNELSKEQVHRDKMARAGISAFFRMMEAWGVNDVEAHILLGRPERSIFSDWQNGKVTNLSHDTLIRISYLLGIYKALQIIYSMDRDYADQWVKRPNSAFGGQSALEHMLGGQITDLADVRAYLDANLQGWS